MNRRRPERVSPRGARGTQELVKLDPDPIDGLRTGLERWGEVGDEGVLCLLSDSTNSELTYETGSESVVAETLERLFHGVKGRIVVALVASNLHRVHTLLKLPQSGAELGLEEECYMRRGG
ncbi:MAG TPA: hypothetical protein VNA24_35765 [Hyalangium sp.]|jgi:ribonuclease J|nr:hypothetical protein [Hyalangium sp.]